MRREAQIGMHLLSGVLAHVCMMMSVTAFLTVNLAISPEQCANLQSHRNDSRALV
jgi:hypothetical protein